MAPGPTKKRGMGGCMVFFLVVGNLLILAGLGLGIAGAVLMGKHGCKKSEFRAPVSSAWELPCWCSQGSHACAHACNTEGSGMPLLKT